MYVCVCVCVCIVCCQWVLFAFHFGLEYFVSDQTNDVAIQYKRATFITDVVLAGKDLTPYIVSRQALSTIANKSSVSGATSVGANGPASTASTTLSTSRSPTVLATPVRASMQQHPTPASTVPSFRIHDVGPAYIPMHKLPFSPSKSLTSVQPEEP